MRRGREEGRKVREVDSRDLEVQQQERFKKVQRWNKKVITLGLPKYLRGWGRKERLIRIARFRLGCEMRERRYWDKKDNRRCRGVVGICGEYL